MTVYRTSGPWGVGKGSNLQPSEVDENFYELVQRVVDLENNPEPGVGIADITVDGSTFTVQLTDGSILGPFPLPIAAFSWRGAWITGETYSYLDLFSHDGAVFMVLQDYEAPTEFNPNETNTEGPLLALMLAPPVAELKVVNVVNAHHTLEIGDVGVYLRFSSTVNRSLVVPSDDEINFPIGSIISFRQVNIGQVSAVSSNTEVVINSSESHSLRKSGSTGQLIKVAPNEWDLSGDLELADLPTEEVTV